MTEYRCPACGSTRLAVVIEAWAELVQEADNLQTDLDGTCPDHDDEWDNESLMRCLECGFEEKAGRF